MSLVAIANGYGVISANISDTSLQKYNNDTYLSCLNDLNLGTIDVCIGKLRCIQLYIYMFYVYLY